jgi:hypothetical protein
MNAVQALVTAFAPWQALYSDSKLVSTTVTTTHILALVVGGGIAIASDRSTLRALRGSPGERQYHLQELHSAHSVVISALAVLFVSGALLAAADIETFAASPIFWLKLGLVALLCSNGLWLYRTEHRIAALEEPAPALWRRLKWSAWISLTLWLLVAIAGTVLTNS